MVALAVAAVLCCAMVCGSHVAVHLIRAKSYGTQALDRADMALSVAKDAVRATGAELRSVRDDLAKESADVRATLGTHGRQMKEMDLLVETLRSAVVQREVFK